jgi:hypothetical protein
MSWSSRFEIETVCQSSRDGVSEFASSRAAKEVAKTTRLQAIAGASD